MGYKQQQMKYILNATLLSFSTTSFVFLSFSAIYEHNDVSWYFPPGPGRKKRSRERKSCMRRIEAGNAVLCSSLLTFSGFDWSTFMNYYRGLVPAWLGCCWSELAGQVVQFLISDDRLLLRRSTEELFWSEVNGTKQTPSSSLTSRPDLCFDMIVAGEYSIQQLRVHFHFCSKRNVCGIRVLQSSPELVKAFYILCNRLDTSLSLNWRPLLWGFLQHQLFFFSCLLSQNYCVIGNLEEMKNK